MSLFFCSTPQAQPLVMDLKDLFQVIFNTRKKEVEATQKVRQLLETGREWVLQLHNLYSLVVVPKYFERLGLFLLICNVLF